MEQHDDHCWLTVHGEGWAILNIQRFSNSTVIILWRGYEPLLEFQWVEISNPNWEEYCEQAVKMLQEHYGTFGET